MPTAIYTKFSPSEINKLLKLLIPLALTGCLEASVGFSSTLFLAHLGTKELAAGAIAQWVFITLIVVLWGTLSSVSVVVSQKYGAQDEPGIAQTLLDGIVLGLLVTIPAILVLKNITPILLFFGQNPITVTYVHMYMQGLVWALLPDFMALVLLQFLIGLGHTRTNMFFSMSWVPLNIFCNFGFVFGKFGFPKLGLAGIGWGMALSYWVSFLALSLYLSLKTKYRHYFKMMCQLRQTHFLELCHIGFPVGLMYCIEIGFFLTLTMLMGNIGITELAANQITLQFMGQASVMTFAVAQAITIRMGHTLGAKQPYLAQRAVYIGICVAVGFMLLVALCYWFIPEKLIGVDLNIGLAKNTKIIAYASQFLAFCAGFQLLEAVRFALFGGLRSLKDTRFTLLISIITFWGVGLPIGYFCAFKLGIGGVGLWYGMVLGASLGVLLLAFRFRFKMRQQFV